MSARYRGVAACYLGLTILPRFAMAFIAGSYSLYLVSHGLNVLEVNLVNLVFWSMLLLSELPTGALADLYGRRKCFVASCHLTAAGALIYAGGNSFAAFAMAEACSAVGKSLSNGSFQAWMVDSLDDTPDKNARVGRILAQEGVWGNLACIGGALIGGLMTVANPKFPWYAMAAAFTLTGLLAAVWMKEGPTGQGGRFPSPPLTPGLAAKIRTGWHIGRTHAPIRFVLAYTFVIMLGVQAPNMQWQLWFSRYEVGPAVMGLLAAGIFAFLAFGAYLAAYNLRTGQSERRLLIGWQVLAGVGMILTVLLPSLSGGAAAFFLHEIARGAMQPIRSAYLNQHVTAAERATLLSLGSLPGHLGGMIGLLASGLLALHSSIPLTWVCSGLFLILTTVWLSRSTKFSSA
jgi:MFS family permease